MERSGDEADPTRPEVDLYTIPVASSWFKWEDIHEKERAELKEFFEGGSQTRTPKIYKEYRDFLINKFREDPTRRLSFSHARGSLVGDASLLLKVFRFLDRHGLINFPLPPPREDDDEEGEHVRVETGPPAGVRVSGVEGSGSGSGRGGTRREHAPLASYTDVFEARIPACGSCGGGSSPVQFEYTKGDFVICGKCFEEGSFGGEGRAKEDFKVGDGGEGKKGVVLRGGGSWSDEESLLLLESVLRHGDDWDLVVKDVPTKSKDDCIAKLIELPFGDLFMGSTPGKDCGGSSGGLVGVESVTEGVLPSSESLDLKVDGYEHHGEEQTGDTGGANEGPPLKRQRAGSLFDASSSLMEQVARITTVVGSDITSAAANAAVGAICDQISCPRELFDVEDFLTKLSPSPSLHTGPERPNEDDDSKAEGKDDDPGGLEMPLPQNGIPLSLQLRAAVATTLGASAAHARVLAAQEDREIETLMATLLETQLKKLSSKIKDFGELELIMEKERAELVELKESLVEDRIYVLQQLISAGSSKWRS